MAGAGSQEFDRETVHLFTWPAHARLLGSPFPFYEFRYSEGRGSWQINPQTRERARETRARHLRRAQELGLRPGRRDRLPGRPDHHQFQGEEGPSDAALLRGRFASADRPPTTSWRARRPICRASRKQAKGEPVAFVRERARRTTGASMTQDQIAQVLVPDVFAETEFKKMVGQRQESSEEGRPLRHSRRRRAILCSCAKKPCPASMSISTPSRKPAS